MKRALSTTRAAGQIEDEGCPDGSADGAAECGEGSLERSRGAHPFGQSVNDALADHPGGFGRDIARGKSCASSGKDEICGFCTAAQSSRDRFQFIGHNLAGDGCEPSLLEQICYERAREVLPGSLKGAVADGQDQGTRLGGKSWAHLLSLRPLVALLQEDRLAFGNGEKIKGGEKWPPARGG